MLWFQTKIRLFCAGFIYLFFFLEPSQVDQSIDDDDIKVTSIFSEHMSENDEKKKFFF